MTKAALAALVLGLSSCGGTAFTAAALGSEEAGDAGNHPLEAGVPLRDSAPAGDASSGGGEAGSPPDGGTHEASTVEAGDSSAPTAEASADSSPPMDAPNSDGGLEADAAGDGDGWVCTLLPPDAAPFGCFGALTRPADYALRVVSPGHPDGGCAEQTTPLACQCAETYTCACIAQTPGLACAGSGVWQGCVMQDGVPVVTCSN